MVYYNLPISYEVKKKKTEKYVYFTSVFRGCSGYTVAPPKYNRGYINY